MLSAFDDALSVNGISDNVSLSLDEGCVVADILGDRVHRFDPKTARIGQTVDEWSRYWAAFLVKLVEMTKAK